MLKQKGFSLIELLIVVAIILIIAAIAIPGFMRARLSANESSAVGSIRTIVTTNVQFATTYGTGFAPALANLGGAAGCVAAAANACLIDPALTTGSKSGYQFAAVPSGGAGTAVSPFTAFEVEGHPQTVGVSGQRSFCADQSGVIHFDITGATFATAPGTCGATPAVQVLR